MSSPTTTLADEAPQTPKATMIETETLVKAFRLMSRIRIAEQMIAADYMSNKIFSFLHLYVGQEAVATGVCMGIAAQDRVFGNHRSHGHYLAKGGDLKRMFCEVYGKAEGCCHGKGGSMHMLDRSVAFMGSTPILASVVPIATGSAFAQKMTSDGTMTVAFFGDGASEEGVVYESINIATVLKLPVLFVLENNYYSVMSDRSVRRSERFSLRKLVLGIGADYILANGNSFSDVYSKTQQARSMILKGDGPVVLEAKVFRHMAHSGPIFDDSIGYRKVDKRDKRDKACPIKNVRKLLSARKFPETELLQVETEEKETIKEAFDYAKSSPMPEVSELLKDVYHV
jgi:TPP-dependent pyruvate/acetoin dehydrogenase alpha subunit